MKINKFTLLSVTCLAWHSGFAQKGLPSETPTSTTVSTTYPQHEDFNPALISRLTVPAGYKVAAVATGLGKPRIMAVNKNGDLYVSRRDQGDVILLNNKDAEGKFQGLKYVMTKFPGVHGLTIHDGYLYMCANKMLKRSKIKPDGTLEEAETLIYDLPDASQHANRTIAFGPDGFLYITIGSTCNDCNETIAENATVLRATADGKSRKIFARGLRNTLGIDWHPVTKEMWGADNGSDAKGENLPGEELNKIVEDGHYGWPLVFEDQKVDNTREDPAGTTKAEFAKKTIGSSYLLPSHGAPLDFKFVDANTALVTLHGSWNRKAPQGYMVKRVRFENGMPVSDDNLLAGFLSKNGDSRFGRPVALALFNGTVYVSDDVNGVIYSVSPSN